MGKFAENLARLRVEKDLTQDELARRVGVSQPAIAQYEKGTLTPKLYVTMRLANVFGVTIEQLVNGKEETA
jgi:transcriptional regulator with XRE-family HTH domain